MRRAIMVFAVLSSLAFEQAFVLAEEPSAKRPVAKAESRIELIRMPTDKTDWAKSKPELIGKIPFRTVSPAVTVSMGQQVAIMLGLGNVKGLAFLISSGGDLPRDTTIAKMTMTCASGKEQTLALTAGKTTYYNHADLRGFPKSKAGNYRIIWTNPKPADAILTITFADVGQTGSETRCEAITTKPTQAGFVKITREAMGKALKGKARDDEEDWQRQRAGLCPGIVLTLALYCFAGDVSGKFFVTLQPAPRSSFLGTLWEHDQLTWR